MRIILFPAPRRVAAPIAGRETREGDGEQELGVLVVQRRAREVVWREGREKALDIREALAEAGDAREGLLGLGHRRVAREDDELAVGEVEAELW